MLGFLFFLASTLFTMARWTGVVDEKLDILADKIEQRRIDDSFQYQELKIKTDALTESMDRVRGATEQLKECKRTTDSQGRKLINLGNAVDWLSGRVKHLEDIVKGQQGGRGDG